MVRGGAGGRQGGGRHRRQGVFMLPGGRGRRVERGPPGIEVLGQPPERLGHGLVRRRPDKENGEGRGGEGKADVREGRCKGITSTSRGGLGLPRNRAPKDSEPTR